MTRSMIKKVLVLAGLPLLLAGIALPCVKDGGHGTVTLPRPPLPDAPSGSPGASTWGGNPTAEEHDDASPNDPMGDATPDSTGDNASVDISNKGGDLSGPNGKVQNGGGEGKCIEVQICWSYWTWVSRSQWIIDGETGEYILVFYWSWEEKEVCNGGNDVEVCPC